MAGIEEVCADIRDRGERSVVITMSPDDLAAAYALGRSLIRGRTRRE